MSICVRLLCNAQTLPSTADSCTWHLILPLSCYSHCAEVITLSECVILAVDCATLPGGVHLVHLYLVIVAWIDGVPQKLGPYTLQLSSIWHGTIDLALGLGNLLAHVGHFLPNNHHFFISGYLRIKRIYEGLVIRDLTKHPISVGRGTISTLDSPRLH